VGEFRIIAVEPSEGMRAAFVAAVPRVPVLDGTAERIPLGDGVADAVIVGQAFHWFRPEAALPEIARVLRPSGSLGIVSNTRDESVPWVKRFGDLLREVRTGAVPSASNEGWLGAFTPPERFEALSTAKFVHRQRMPRAALMDRALSVSYVAGLAQDAQAALAERIRQFADDDPELSGRPEIEFPYVTEIFWARRR
jgi:SAM-dependent methyltransferase